MLSKNSFNKKRRFSLEISKKKIFVGCLLGIGLSVTFYSFLKLFCKILLFFDASFNEFELIILSEKNNNLLNFLFAFIAVYFSFSVIFSFLIETPKKFLSKNNYKRNNVLNQQRLTNWFFLNWFFRMAILFGLLALDINSSNFLTDNYSLFLLFIIAFTGQIWITIRHFLAKNKLKWLLVTFATTLSLAFLISKIEVLNNKVIDESILSKNILYRNKIERVYSDNFQSLPNYRSLYFNVYLKESRGRLIIETDNYSLSQSKSLKEKIDFFKSRISTAEYPYIAYILHIDKNVKMKTIIELKKTLKKENANTIYYAIADKDAPFYYKSQNAFGFHLKKEEDKISINDALKIKIIDDKFIFENNILSKKELKKSIKKSIDKKGFSPFILSFKNDTKFEDYFNLLSLTKEIITEYRDSKSLKSYGEKYATLPKNNKKLIREEVYWSFKDDLE